MQQLTQLGQKRVHGRRSTLFSRLRVRLLLLIGVALLPMLVLIFINALSQRANLAQAVQNEALRLTELIAANQQQYLNVTREFLFTLSQLPIVRERNWAACDVLFADLLKEFPIYTNISSNDEMGNVRCSALPLTAPINVFNENWYQEMVERQEFIIDDYRVGQISGRALIILSHPVFDYDNVWRGVVSVGLSLDWLNTFVANTVLPEGATLMVVDDEGVVLAVYPEVQEWIGNPIPDTTLFDDVVARGQGVTESDDVYGDHRLYGFTRLGDAPSVIYIMLSVPEALALAQSNAFVEQMILSLLFVSLLVLVTVWLASDVLLLRPLKHLLHATGRLGKGDLTTRVPMEAIGGIDELNLLGSSFNDMAGALEQREAELARSNTELGREVEERKQAEEALRQSETKFRAIFNQTFQLVALLQPDGTLVEINETALRFTQQSASTFVGIRPEGWAVINSLDMMISLLNEAITQAAEGQLVRFEGDFRHPDGTITVLDASVKPIFNDNGDVTLLIAEARDITQRKRAEEALRENMVRLAAEEHARVEAEKADQVKLKFLAMISHELRTPLASIKGFITTLLAEDVTWDAESQREFLNVINEESDKLEDLVEQLLDVSRIQAGTLRMDPAPRAMRDIIGIAMAQLQTQATEHSLVLDIASDLPPVMADEQRIAQVVVNLVSNAVKYAPADSQITLRAYAAGDFVQMDVIDQGEGIPLEEHPYVFEAFRQVDRKTQSQKGAGLGLAICKGVVEAHGGRIWLSSPDGGGLVVSFTLPVILHEEHKDGG